MENDQLGIASLFENEEVDTGRGKLSVVQMQYVSAEQLTWKELFSGFDTIHAITYSSGLPFIYQLLDMFENAEIVFGNESVMSYSLSEIMAFQTKLIEKIRSESDKKENLLEKIRAGKAHFYVSREMLSHEKIYLLESEDGRKRVITGSANMSLQAFGGYQRENICYLDGDEAFDWYYDSFVALRNNSTDEISEKAILVADASENLDELPVSKTVKTNKVLEVISNPEEVEKINFALDVKNLDMKLKPYAPKEDKKTKRVLITPDMLVKMQRNIKNELIREKELRSEYPQLNIDAFTQSVTLNGQKLDLNPSSEEIGHDVELFLKYMDGYSKFHGDTVGMQYRYYEFANWFFCSPFMAVMRDMAARFDQQRLPYPVFGLVYGKSKAGKTSFLETLLKMMIGQKPKISAPEFTRSSIEGLKRTVQGAPIIVDDLTNNRFNQHAIETIKNDDFGVAEHLVNYSAVVISANEDVKAVAPEVIRRTVICRVEAGLTNTEVMKSNTVRYVQQNIGTAFYREYLRRMLEKLPDLMEELKNEDAEAPDILNISSQVILDIIQTYEKEPRNYIRELSLENYFSEQVTGKHAIKTIQTAWKTSRKSFAVSSKNNELRYNAGATYEADRLMKELPETLEAHKSREWIVMNLDAAREFFGVNFKRRLF